LYFWDDIADALRLRGHVLREVHSDVLQLPPIFTATASGIYHTALGGASNPIQECAEIFDAPEVRFTVGEELRLELRSVITELALNAFRHGSARKGLIELGQNSLRFEDDGLPFQSPRSYQGK